MKEIITKETTIYEGKILTLKLDDVIANGHEAKREIVRKGGAVAIIPIKANGNIVMVRQYRIAVDEELLEIPAGLMDPGEEPLETAKRELKEETGYTAAKWTHITEFYPTAGFCDEYVHIFMAEELTPGETCFDETESLEIEEYKIDDLMKMILSGEIHDGKTVAGISLAKCLLR